jgi:hypothetical protein
VVYEIALSEKKRKIPFSPQKWRTYIVDASIFWEDR